MEPPRRKVCKAKMAKPMDMDLEEIGTSPRPSPGNKTLLRSIATADDEDTTDGQTEVFRVSDADFRVLAVKPVLSIEALEAAAEAESAMFGYGNLECNNVPYLEFDQDEGIAGSWYGVDRDREETDGSEKTDTTDDSRNTRKIGTTDDSRKIGTTDDSRETDTTDDSQKTDTTEDSSSFSLPTSSWSTTSTASTSSSSSSSSQSQVDDDEYDYSNKIRTRSLSKTSCEYDGSKAKSFSEIKVEPVVLNMIPITIHSTLRQVQNRQIWNTLCPRDKTWAEFLCLFNVRLDPTRYYVRGTYGRRCSLLDKIDDYGKKFQRKLNSFVVHIERYRAGLRKFTSVSKDPSPTYPKPKPAAAAAKMTRFSGRRRHRNGHAPYSWPTDRHGNPVKPQRLEPGQPVRVVHRRRRRKTKQEPPAVLTPSLCAERRKLLSLACEPKGPVPKKLRTDMVFPSRVKTEEAASSVSRPKAARVSSSSNQPSHSSQTPNCKNVRPKSDVVNQSPPKPEVVQLKPAVLEFLANKISNDNMVRVRDELTTLKANDDYFKLTLLSPLAAGLLEQLFFRNDRQD